MRTNISSPNTNPTIIALPPVLTVRALHEYFGICRTTAYLLASAGEIESLTLNMPGKTKGKRVFLTESVLAYVERKRTTSPPLNCKARAAKTTGNGTLRAAA